MAPAQRLTARAFLSGLEVCRGNLLGYALVFLVVELPFVLRFVLDPQAPLAFDAPRSWNDVMVAVMIDPPDVLWTILLSAALQTAGAALVLLSIFHALEGTPVSLGASVRSGLRRVFPVLVTSFLIGALFVYGLLLFVVPALLVLAYMGLAIPACVVERRSPLRSLGRSGDLAGGFVLATGALALLVFIAPRVLEVALATGLRETPAAAFAAVLVLRVAFGTLAAIAVAVAYRELRRIKEHTEVRSLIEAFE